MHISAVNTGTTTKDCTAKQNIQETARKNLGFCWTSNHAPWICCKIDVHRVKYFSRWLLVCHVKTATYDILFTSASMAKLVNISCWISSIYATYICSCQATSLIPNLSHPRKRLLVAKFVSISLRLVGWQSRMSNHSGVCDSARRHICHRPNIIQETCILDLYWILLSRRTPKSIFVAFLAKFLLNCGASICLRRCKSTYLQVCIFRRT